MTKQTQFRRVWMFTLLVCAAFAGLGYRLVDIQVVRHDEFSARAQEGTERETIQAPRRGDILDARGNPLATSVPVKTIVADPSLIGNQQAAVARAIAPLLGLPEADVYQKLFPRIGKNDRGELVTNNLHYVRLQKNVSEADWQKIQAAMSGLSFGLDEKKLPKSQRDFLAGLRKSAIYAEPDQLRVYPNGSLAAQVLGFSGSKDFKAGNHFVSQIVGRDGI